MVEMAFRAFDPCYSCATHSLPGQMPLEVRIYQERRSLSPFPAMKTLLLGMGNPILCDDAVGVRLARDFKAKLAPIPDLDVMEECSVGGLNLLDVFCRLRTGHRPGLHPDRGGIPGDWYYFTAAALPASVHLTNIHDANFATAWNSATPWACRCRTRGDPYLCGGSRRRT